MKINAVQNNINFRAIKLSEKDLAQSSEIFEKLLNPKISNKEELLSKSSLYNIFRPYIKAESKLKAKASYIFEEIFSEMSLNFFELLNNIRQYASLETFIKELDKFRPAKDLIKSEYLYKSLDDNIYRISDNKVKRIERITEDDLPNPTSAVVIDEAKRKLNKIIENAQISETKKRRMKNRAIGMKYKEIASAESIAASTARNSVIQSIHKIQYQKGKLPEKLIDYSKTMSKILNCNTDDFINYALNDNLQMLFNLNIETVKRNLEILPKSFGCSLEEFVQAGLKSPNLLYQCPETLINNSKESARLLECALEEFVKAGLKRPDLFQYKPKRLKNYVTSSSALLGCSFKEFTEICLKQPQLFCQNPNTLADKISVTSKLLGCSVESFVKAGMKQPSLFCQNPETLSKNVRESSQSLSWTFEQFVKMGLKQPNLFHRKPESLIKNTKESSKMLGCSFEEFTKACLRQPPLLCLSPQALANNVKKSAGTLGWTADEFIKAGLKQPQLFCMNPQTLGKKLKIENYYRNIQNKSAGNKLSRFDSDKKMYSKILGFLIKKNDQNLIKNINDYNLEEFLRLNSDKNFSFEIPENVIAKDLIKFAQETSIKTIGKNIFEFKIMN